MKLEFNINQSVLTNSGKPSISFYCSQCNNHFLDITSFLYQTTLYQSKQFQLQELCKKFVDNINSKNFDMFNKKSTGKKLKRRLCCCDPLAPINLKEIIKKKEQKEFIIRRAEKIFGKNDIEYELVEHDYLKPYHVIKIFVDGWGTGFVEGTLRDIEECFKQICSGIKRNPLICPNCKKNHGISHGDFVCNCGSKFYFSTFVSNRGRNPKHPDFNGFQNIYSFIEKKFPEYTPSLIEDLIDAEIDIYSLFDGIYETRQGTESFPIFVINKFVKKANFETLDTKTQIKIALLTIKNENPFIFETTQYDFDKTDSAFVVNETDKIPTAIKIEYTDDVFIGVDFDIRGYLESKNIEESVIDDYIDEIVELLCDIDFIDNHTVYDIYHNSYGHDWYYGVSIDLSKASFSSPKEALIWVKEKYNFIRSSTLQALENTVDSYLLSDSNKP